MEKVPGVLSRSDAENIGIEVFSRVHAREAIITVGSHTVTTADFANNDMSNMSGDAGSVVRIVLSIDGHQVSGSTEDVTTGGLSTLLDDIVGLAAHDRQSMSEGLFLASPENFSDPPIYFESTLAGTVAGAQGDLLRSAANLADEARQIGAGTLKCAAGSSLLLTTTGVKAYTRATYGEFSMNSRTASHAGSGWAWSGSEDFANVNVEQVARRAIDIAKRSDNPVSIEPGRYVVIIEPEAVAQLVDLVIGAPTAQMALEFAEQGYSAFARVGGGSKLGLRIVDARINLLSDPLDPLMPFSPLGPNGYIMKRTSWIAQGVLTNLATSFFYAQQRKRAPVVNPNCARLEMTGESQTLDRMIASTQRGIWVHRFSDFNVMNGQTLQLSAVTRDGTFLIENGKVTKPIKNMRFAESPFFILNKLDSSGVPARGSENIVCPRLKVHDFEFTSLSDAI